MPKPDLERSSAPDYAQIPDDPRAKALKPVECGGNPYFIKPIRPFEELRIVAGDVNLRVFATHLGGRVILGVAVDEGEITVLTEAIGADFAEAIRKNRFNSAAHGRADLTGKEACGATS